MNLREQLVREEGRRYEAYPDPLTGGAPWTIGVGHTGPEVHQGLVWTDDQIDAALSVDIADAVLDCSGRFPWYQSLSDPRQAVLAGMRFQMGMSKLLGFKETLAAARDERFAHAAECMRRSLWAKQTPKRARRMATQMETGEWQ